MRVAFQFQDWLLWFVWPCAIPCPVRTRNRDTFPGAEPFFIEWLALILLLRSFRLGVCGCFMNDSTAHGRELRPIQAG